MEIKTLVIVALIFASAYVAHTVGAEMRKRKADRENAAREKMQLESERPDKKAGKKSGKKAYRKPGKKSDKPRTPAR